MACTANIVALSTRGLFKGCTRWVRREKKGKKVATTKKYDPSVKRTGQLQDANATANALFLLK